MFYSLILRNRNNDKMSNEMKLAIAIYGSSDILWEKANPPPELVHKWAVQYRKRSDFNHHLQMYWTKRIRQRDEATSRQGLGKKHF
jgi:hypothetical protein